MNEPRLPGATFAEWVDICLKQNEDELRQLRGQLSNYSMAQLFHDQPNTPKYWAPIVAEIRYQAFDLLGLAKGIAATYGLKKGKPNE
jgi:hypothetical protein